MMKSLLTMSRMVMAVVILPSLSFADQEAPDLDKLTTTQTWVGKNGRVLRGIFVKRDGDQVEILTEKGKKIKVGLADLSESTRKWFHRAWQAKLDRIVGEDISETQAKDLFEFRVWHGSNGKHIRGRFHAKEGDQLRISDTRGKIYKIPLTALSDEDRIWFNQVWKAHQEKKTEIKGLPKGGDVEFLDDLILPSVAPVGFQRVPKDRLNRLNIPLLDQAEYHDKDFNNFPSSMVPFLLWWHNYKIINIEVRRDDNEKRVKWLYRTTNRHELGVRYSPISKYREFFQQDLKASAYFQVLDLRDGKKVYEVHKTLDRFSPEFLSQYTQGANATILSVNVYKKGRKEWTADLPLVKCTPVGDVVFYMFGDIKLTGKLVKLPFDKKEARKRGDRLPRYEIKIDNMGELDDWFQGREYTFFLEGKKGVGLRIIIPSIEETEPKDEAK